MSTNKVSLFINIDRNKETCEVNDFVEEKYVISEDFFTRNNIKDKNSFNLLDIIKQNSDTRRRFWGWDCWIDRGFWICCHYVFWLETSCEMEPLQ